MMEAEVAPVIIAYENHLPHSLFENALLILSRSLLGCESRPFKASSFLSVWYCCEDPSPPSNSLNASMLTSADTIK
jgi:hypothetical protein